MRFWWEILKNRVTISMSVQRQNSMNFLQSFLRNLETWDNHLIFSECSLMLSEVFFFFFKNKEMNRKIYQFSPKSFSYTCLVNLFYLHFTSHSYPKPFFHVLQYSILVPTSETRCFFLKCPSFYSNESR